MGISQTPTIPAAGMNGSALGRQLLRTLSQRADEEVALGELTGRGPHRMDVLQHLAWGTRQPCPGTLELTKTLPCALLTNVHYKLQAETDPGGLGAFVRTVADTSFCENSSQAQSKSARVRRGCEDVGQAWRDPGSHCPYKLNSRKCHTCLERQLDGVQSLGRPADDRQGNHVLPRVHPAVSALGKRHALRG